MTVQIRNPELIRLLAADFVTRRELVTTPGNRVTLTNTDLTVAGGGALTLSATGAYTLTVPETGTAVLLTATQTLTNKTLTTPTIGDFTNAAHDHEDAAGGGQLSLTTAVSGILPPANGGTGVNNDTRTLTINTNSGTLAFGAASKTLTVNENLNLSGASGQTLTLTNSLTVQGGGNTVLSSSGNFTLTIPKTGTVPVGTGTAGRIAEWVTDANTVQASTLAKTGAGVLTLAASGNFTLTVPATGTAALLGTAQTFTENQTIDANKLLIFNTTSSTGKYRVGGLTNVSDWGGMLLNANFNGSTWDLDKTNLDGYFFKLDVRQNTAGVFNGLWCYRVPNGPNPHTDEYPVFGVTNGYSFLSDRLGINTGSTTLPSALLHVNQSSSFGAVPTLRLRQADLTREFIRFETTVGTGNPINTTALGTYYGRVRVWVEGVGERWLALYNT